MLSKFILPSGSKNAIYEATWTPISLSLIKKMNQYDMENPKVKLQTKLSTFPSKNTRIKTIHKLSKKLRVKISNFCEETASHIFDVTKGGTIVTTLELTFKLDSTGQLWVLYCTRVKIREGTNNKSHNSSRTFSVIKHGNSSNTN